MEKLNAQAKGMFKLEMAGGPEVIPSFDQGAALKKGTIGGLFYCPPEYTAAQSPASICQALCPYTAMEERQKGIFKIWQQYYETTLNAHYLGRMAGTAAYRGFLNKKVAKVEDYKGLILRVSPLYEPFTKALGAKPVMIPLQETYTALERGTIDGQFTAEYGLPSFGTQKVTKYIVSPKFFQVSGGRFINLDLWNSLPKEAQDLLDNTSPEWEIYGNDNEVKNAEIQLKVCRDAGMIDITLDPGEDKKFLDIVYGSTWDYIVAQDPVTSPKFKELYTKK